MYGYEYGDEDYGAQQQDEQPEPPKAAEKAKVKAAPAEKPVAEVKPAAAEQPPPEAEAAVEPEVVEEQTAQQQEAAPGES